MSSNPVELGFTKKSASWKLKSKFFRSKIGGEPSWLSLNNLPDSNDLLCKSCGKPCVFLLQVYAPLPENEDSFHRTIFVFMCPNGKCSQSNSNDCFLVFRSQLPRKNDFYSFEAPVDIEKDSNVPSADQYQSLCDVCRCKAALNCEKCSKKSYCSQEHLTFDLNHGHKDICGVEAAESNGVKKKRKKPQNHFLLPEFELVTETEDLPDVAPEKSDEEKMRDYHKFMSSAKAPQELQNVPLDDLDALMKNNDKIFNKFQKRIKLEPEQVLRYQRGGLPLWVSSEHVPSESEIPHCPCGANRLFEFQVMPQLLNYLSLDTVEDSVDWGTLAVYACSKSCNEGTAAYTKEILWKQDFSKDSKSLRVN